ncbi:uncharacterized protein LACBIDRAFT_331430 [Laccaria bicolor S238N-H82]|uniref:Predicted protein n=1 Tax=Laccaria bicolor (strain S238N-H82 / ATCC MYA-4686) TaxID=486041 RepID=B0DPG1_LACBS|nr:uncharacterized protein LACBIDRAFT_331430 [Laccaria bicolor S238N-H82]EDR03369.1 predicted protein [Laccaria bicolor S238N-H82]|eukprot:XP_001885825.1 predicted protein [Laccaria bicolor S238N-H82]
MHYRYATDKNTAIIGLAQTASYVSVCVSPSPYRQQHIPSYNDKLSCLRTWTERRRRSQDVNLDGRILLVDFNTLSAEKRWVAAYSDYGNQRAHTCEIWGRISNHNFGFKSWRCSRAKNRGRGLRLVKLRAKFGNPSSYLEQLSSLWKDSSW